MGRHITPTLGAADVWEDTSGHVTFPNDREVDMSAESQSAPLMLTVMTQQLLFNSMIRYGELLKLMRRIVEISFDSPAWEPSRYYQLTLIVK